MSDQTPNGKTSSFWLLCLATLAGAIGAGLGAFYFAWVESTAEGPLQRLYQAAPWVPFLVIPGMLYLILWLRDKYFSGTDGTGIPQTMAALELGPGKIRNQVLSLRVAFGKLLLTTMGLCSYLSIGREGPSVQLGACFMHFFSKLARFPAYLMRRGLILAGGAAGIAAAFNAPIAGIVFSMEEIGRSFDKRNMGVLVLTVTVACAICVIALGNGYFYGNLDQGRSPLAFYSWKEWLLVPIIGITGGLLGGFFSRGLLTVMPWISCCIRNRKLATAITLGIIIACLGWISAGQTHGSGFAQAQALLLQGSPELEASLGDEKQNQLRDTREALTPLYPLYRAVATFLVLLTAVPGGLFDPSFSVGAGLGHSLSPLLDWFGAQQQAIILLFIVAYFSGVVQSPMTSFIILLEMTGTILFSLPLAGTAIIAYLISKRICKESLYEALAKNFVNKEEVRKDHQ